MRITKVETETASNYWYDALCKDGVAYSIPKK